MPPTLITTDTIVRAGTLIGPGAEVDADTVNGNVYRNSGVELILARNSDGAADHDISVEVAIDIDGISVPPRTVTIPKGKAGIFGPLPPDIYNQSIGGVRNVVRFTADDAAIKLQILGPA